MVFHDGLGMVVMVNGAAGENPIWGWSGGAWQVVGENGPDGRGMGGVAYDPGRDRLVFYGGYSLANNTCRYDTWEWDGENWLELGVPAPDVCSHFSMEFDHGLGQVVLFGGADDQTNAHTGTWTWDGQQWERIERGEPETRFHSMSASDPAHQNIFLFGGFSSGLEMFDEFWAWDGTTWELLDLPGPAARSHARMAFDSTNVQLVLFGGSTSSRIPLELQNDTWVLTDGAWGQAIGPAPSPRGGHVMAYDPLQESVILYGGFDSEDQELADTWEWREGLWTCVDGCEPGLGILVPPSFGPEVALYRADEHRSGVYSFPAIRSQPTLAWETDSSESYFTDLLSHDGALYAGSFSGKLYALDADTGEILWRGGDFTTGVTAPAIAGDVIVAGGFNNIVQALDRRSGEVIWTTETESPPVVPLIANGRLYVATWNKFYALALETGEEIWSVPTGEDPRFIGAPAYEEGVVYLSEGNSFLALDAETGAEVWRVDKETPYYFFATGSDLGYVGNEDGFFYAYDLSTGDEVWSYDGGAEIWFGPAVTDEVVYVGNWNSSMLALDARTGEELWEFETTQEAVSDALLSDGVLYFSDCNHDGPSRECRLYALEAETGTQLWEYAGTGNLLPSPALGDGVIYISLGSSIQALE